MVSLDEVADVGLGFGAVGEEAVFPGDEVAVAGFVDDLAAGSGRGLDGPYDAVSGVVEDVEFGHWLRSSEWCSVVVRGLPSPLNIS